MSDFNRDSALDIASDDLGSDRADRGGHAPLLRSAWQYRRGSVGDPGGPALAAGSAWCAYRDWHLSRSVSHAHLPHARDCDGSTEVAGAHQPKACDTSTEVLLGRVTRTCTQRSKPTGRFELPASGLRNRCSTTELRRQEPQ